VALEVFGDVRAVAVLVDGLDDRRTGRARAGEMRIEIVDEHERHVRDAAFRVGRFILVPEQHERAVADAELDPRHVLATLRQDRRIEPERRREPPGRGHGPVVVQDEVKPGLLLDLPRRGLASCAPFDEPVRHDAHERKAAGDVLIPTREHARVNLHSGSGFDRRESHIDLDIVDRTQPLQPRTGLPHGDATELEHVASRIVVHLEDAAADPGFTPAGDRARGVVVADRRPHPPVVHLVGERGERGRGIDPYVDRARDRGELGHGDAFPST
jgi:hypothetical protein